MANPRSADAERKIYFYRARPVANAAKTWKLDRDDLCNAIKALAGTSGYYLDEGDDRITCGEVVQTGDPYRLKFYRVRRRDLPSVDNGAGTIRDLDLTASQGLAEAVHVCLYPDSIVGVEFFYHGPRIGRVQAYMNSARSEQVHLEACIRNDMVERALKFKDLRFLKVKLHPSAISLARADSLNIGGAIRDAKKLDTSAYLELSLRATANDQSFTKKIRGLLSDISGRRDGAAVSVERLEVSGRSNVSGDIETLNLLEEQLVRTELIPKQSTRTRALDSGAAFRAIDSAYKEVKKDLPRDGRMTDGN